MLNMAVPRKSLFLVCSIPRAAFSTSSRIQYRYTPVEKEKTEIDVVDLRSDTLTLPSDQMRKAMAEAHVGDDVFGEDPTINALQKRMADIFGMEASIFVPSGTMGNLCSILSHCQRRGTEVLMGDQCHVFYYEQGGIAQFGGLTPRTLTNLPDGTFDLDEVIHKIRDADDAHQPRTGVICLETTHNRCGGKAIPLEFMQQIKEIATANELKVHLDGARLFNAALALNVQPSDILKHVDSVSMCFSKGLGAPAGSIVAGSAEFIYNVHRLRKAVGGAMRQAGVLAAAAFVGLEETVPLLHKDHQHAKKTARAIAGANSSSVQVDAEGIHSNLLYVDLFNGVTASRFIDRLAKVTEQEKADLKESIVVQGGAYGTHRVRFVFYRDISSEQTDLAIKKILYVIQEMSG
ncbi:probable low-specificity L-threonine aldolase 2 [Lingula anatina]|uniref:Probable low-specificity L-threonine aldolase 2 n=1 Tax=Lingula anatina TaxID=7574 RepID=A0A1S3H219_LINAN|nr:probable low-specificity L-threonine aldolase 2 [Lingula anatina]XP_013379984.1 probable low-specificity L-threonine aldolase 2 [Lingula anatina]XP_013379985.1 probable low-specificity L-threonine aldolase 2 [Lingula anatina]XP_013379986.1 probable low-specificity L-threonine aldolase 2 [Lingula anatina]XP_013379987.1 probable low-specificity L-threonine aldolase 2 [Lingula anatina]|eukprot:XP_013379983.1 probable low-specificity L-threonine aldolase 2 [Lingula anatina]